MARPAAREGRFAPTGEKVTAKLSTGRQRQRQRIHSERIHSGRLDDWAGAQPVGIWPVVRVDTSSPTDFGTLMPELAAHLLN
jgi:hypothetical protein